MQVTETQNDGLKRGYEITVTAEELDAKVNEKLAEAQPTVEMKGFRKGKVPIALLRKQFGPKLLGEAMQEAVDGAMSQHFEETGERPAAQPEVKMKNEDWSEGDDIHVEMHYEALPDVPEVSFADIELTRPVVTPDDAAVDEALNGLAENAQNYEDREDGAAAQSGDQVVIDFVGKLGGEPFEGGAADDFPLTLGSGSFIPGFEEQLEGVKVGDEKTVTVTFPEDYQAPHLAGQAADFDVTVKAVRQPVPAQVDDELAKRYGAEDLDGLRGQIRERLTAEYANASRQVVKRRLLDDLDERVTFDLPPSLVETEAGQIAHQLWHDANPEVQGHDHGEIETTDEHRRLARRRVKLGLLLAEVGRRAEIQVTDQEMSQAVMQQARQYPGQERQFFEAVQKNPQLQQQIQAPLFEDKVVDYVMELAQVTDNEVTKDELQAEVEKLDAEDAQA